MIGLQNGGGGKFVNITENFDGQALLKLLQKFPQRWFFKSSMDIKALQCLPIFHMV